MTVGLLSFKNRRVLALREIWAAKPTRDQLLEWPSDR